MHLRPMSGENYAEWAAVELLFHAGARRGEVLSMIVTAQPAFRTHASSGSRALWPEGAIFR